MESARPTKGEISSGPVGAINRVKKGPGEPLKRVLEQGKNAAKHFIGTETAGKIISRTREKWKKFKGNIPKRSAARNVHIALNEPDPQVGLQAMAGIPVQPEAQVVTPATAGLEPPATAVPEAAQEGAASEPATANLTPDQLAQRNKEILAEAAMGQINDNLPSGQPSLPIGATINQDGSLASPQNPDTNPKDAAATPRSQAGEPVRGQAGETQVPSAGLPRMKQPARAAAEPETSPSVQPEAQVVTPATAGPETPATAVPEALRATAEPVNKPNEVHVLSPNPEATPLVPSKTPDVGEMRARLQEGYNIGGVHFRTDATTVDATKCFADGIKSIIASEDALSLTSQAYIKYIINTAEVSGVSRDQLRKELSDLYEQPKLSAPDVKAGILPGPDIKLFGVLGLPGEMIENPQPATPQQREEAQKNRIDAAADIIRAYRSSGAKLPIEKVLPSQDIRDVAIPILQQFKVGKGRRAEEVLTRMETYASTEDLASIIANPGRFAAQEGVFDVVQLISQRIKNHPGVKRKFGRWRPLDEREKNRILTQEQMAALMATKEELKQIKKDYKKAQGLFEILSKFLLFIAGSTAYQLVSDELEQASGGKV